MRPTARLLLVVVLTACGAAPRAADQPDTAPATEAITESPASTTTTTVAVDRSWPYGVDAASCSLPRVLTETSHLVDARLEDPHVENLVEPWSDVTDENGELPTTPIDFAAATIQEVRLQRIDDPRARFYPPLGSGSVVELFSQVPGSVFADIAGTTTSLAIGQYMIGTDQEWQLQAAMNVAADGAVAFVGPCAPEYDRQLQALADGFDASPNVTFLERMVSEALQPGRGLDEQYYVSPNQWAGSIDGGIPSPLVGRERVIGLYVTPIGTAAATVELRSSIGVTAVSALQAAGGEGWILPAFIATDSPVDFLVAGSSEAETKRLFTIDAATMQSMVGLHVTVDPTTMIATWEPADLQRLSELSSFSVESLQSYKAQYEADMVPSTAVDRPDFYESPPVPS